MSSTIGGMFCALIVGVFDFIMGYKIAIMVVLVSTVFDMIWGIAAAKVQGKYTRSELMRATHLKISGYATVMIMVIILENLVMGGHVVGITEATDERWAVDLVAAIIGATELWSICGNILIVAPNSVFFKLIRNSLVGEIARKLNRSEDEVKDIFDKKGNFKDLNNKKQ